MNDEPEQTIDSFALFDADELEPVDRSDLERWATCPAQAAWYKSASWPVSNLAEAGKLAHDCLTPVIDEYIASGGSLRTPELKDLLEHELRSSRPDLQPEVLAGMRPMAWNICDLIASLNPENILRYDGGRGKRSGQLAIDFMDLGLRATSEIDFLHAGPSPVVLHEKDWKTGHASYGIGDVRQSVQFQMHAALILENYPDIDCVQIEVFMTRLNRTTYPVEFRRRDLQSFLSRIRSAANVWRMYHSRKIEPPTWPVIEKCEQCDAAAVCPVAPLDAKQVAANPQAAVDSLAALQAKVTNQKRRIAAYTAKHGDIVTAAGNAYGRQKPRKKETDNALYTTEPKGS